MKNKKIDTTFTIENEEQAKEFEALYQAYWQYIYKYEIGYPEDFKPDDPWYQRKDFFEFLKEEGRAIHCYQGY